MFLLFLATMLGWYLGNLQCMRATVSECSKIAFRKTFLMLFLKCTNLDLQGIVNRERGNIPAKAHSRHAQDWGGSGKFAAKQ